MGKADLTDDPVDDYMYAAEEWHTGDETVYRPGATSWEPAVLCEHTNLLPI